MNVATDAAAGAPSWQFDRERRGRLVVAAAGTAAAVAALFGLAAGPVAIRVGELLAILGGRLGLDSAEAVSPVRTQVVEQIHPPRVRWDCWPGRFWACPARPCRACSATRWPTRA